MGIRALWNSLVEVSGKRLIVSPLTYAGESDSAITLAIPGYRQLDTFGCGFAAAMMVIHAYFPEVSGTRFYEMLAPDPDWGVQPRQLRSALTRVGIQTRASRRLDFNAIRRTIRSGSPILTTVKKRGVRHWVVLYGCGWNPSRVYVAGNDVPGIGKLFKSHEMSWDEFGAIWKPRGWGIVCTATTES